MLLNPWLNIAMKCLIIKPATPFRLIRHPTEVLFLQHQIRQFSSISLKLLTSNYHCRRRLGLVVVSYIWGVIGICGCSHTHQQREPLTLMIMSLKWMNKCTYVRAPMSALIYKHIYTLSLRCCETIKAVQIIYTLWLARACALMHTYTHTQWFVTQASINWILSGR